MSINRDNYEEFFVLYIDKELNAADRAAVEAFVAQNPDLRTELEMLQQTILPVDDAPVFFDKAFLFKSDSTLTDTTSEIGTNNEESVNELNCEEYFVQYGDNELNNDQNALVEDFIYRHPEYQEHFELIQKVRFQPEKHIVFRDKSILYRSEKDRKVVPMFPVMRTWKIAAAAAVMLMIAGTAWYALKNNNGKDAGQGLATNNPVISQPVDTNAGKKDPATIQRPSTTEDSGLTQSALSTQNSGVAKTSQAADNNESTSDASKTNKKLNASQNNANPSTGSDLALTDNGRKSGRQNDGRSTNQNSIAKTSSKKVEDKSNILKRSDVQLMNGSDKVDVAMSDKKVKNQKNDKNDSGDKIDKNYINDKNVQNDKSVTDQSLANTVTSDKVPDQAVAIGPVELKPNSVFVALANENDEEFEESGKKNKMRGIFRKVTRVFDKATSREPAESRKGVRIASFSIGLK